MPDALAEIIRFHWRRGSTSSYWNRFEQHVAGRRDVRFGNTINFLQSRLYGNVWIVAGNGAARTFLRDLLIQRIQTGTFAEDPDEYIIRLKEGIAAGDSFNHTVHLADGRAFSVVSKPIAAGGWLATHEDVTERQRSEGRIAHMARHDSLTDLPNRVLLRDRLEHELKRVKRGNVWRSFASISTNSRALTTHWHPIGDELLKLVADRLRGCTREPIRWPVWAAMSSPSS